MVPDVLLDHRDQLAKILEVVLLQPDGARPHDAQERGEDLREERDDLEAQRAEDVHDGVDDGRVVVTQGWVVEHDQKRVECNRWVVLVMRGPDVGRVRRVGRVERFDERVVRDALGDLAGE